MTERSVGRRQRWWARRPHAAAASRTLINGMAVAVTIAVAGSLHSEHRAQLLLDAASVAATAPSPRPAPPPPIQHVVVERVVTRYEGPTGGVARRASSGGSVSTVVGGTDVAPEATPAPVPAPVDSGGGGGSRSGGS